MNEQEIKELLESKTVTVGEIVSRIDEVEEKTFLPGHESYNLGVNTMKSAVLSMIYRIIDEKRQKGVA